MCKTNVDSDAAALLFFQAIGIDASQHLYQRGFSVIDVPGGANNDRLHLGQYSRRAHARSCWPLAGSKGWAGRPPDNRREAGATLLRGACATIEFPHMSYSSTPVITPEMIRE